MHQHDSGSLRRAARAWFHAALIVAAGSVTACGGGGDGGSTSGASTSAAAAPAASASAVSSPSAASAASAASDVTTATATAAQAFSSAPTMSAARALPSAPKWAVYYGDADSIDLAKVSSTFNVIVIDADPADGSPSFDATQIAALKAHGAKVLSYLNFGACEKDRTYWSSVPSGFVSCGANAAAQIAKYSGYPEYWMNPANADYQNLIVNYVAARMAATGIDGFMLDNFEIVGHGTSTSVAACDASCAQGGLDLVAKLRARFPDLALVLNAAPASTIGGSTGGVSFPWLIDGVIAEQAFLPSTDTSIVQPLQTWQSTEKNLGRGSFFAGALDYTSSCTATANAQKAWTAARNAGLSPSVATSALDTICWWPMLSAT
jgi:cysteinyl-tRNA synthetase, unknown class